MISIHAPRVGCDPPPQRSPGPAVDFNPRTPCGVRRPFGLLHLPIWAFQSTHPVWGATSTPATAAWMDGDFNPRTPCGVRLLFFAGIILPLLFQSTHPVWGATGAAGPPGRGGGISIHAPRVGCDRHCGPIGGCPVISIHAPRVGCDASGSGKRYEYGDFNPRTPCGVRQQIYTRYEVNRCVPCTDYTV